MPSVSRNQRIAMSIAEHEPDKLYTRNEGMKDMSKSSLHDFASTSDKGLPKHVRKKKKGLENLPSSSDDSMPKDTSSDDKY